MQVKTEAKVIVNVAYSYDIVRNTANNVAQQFNWSDNERVQALCFSNNWVNRFLKRAGMRRRKITREDKDIPKVDEVKRSETNNENRSGNVLNVWAHTEYDLEYG